MLSSLAPSLQAARRGEMSFRLGQSFAFSFAVQGLNAFTGIVLARGLGAQSRGELAAAILWPSIVASVGNLGISDATVYHVAQGRPATRVVVGSVAGIWVVQSALLCLIALLVAPVAVAHYGGDTVRASLLFVASIPFYLATGYAMAVLQGLGRLSAYQTLRLLLVLLIAGGLGSVALIGKMDVTLAVAIYLGAYAVCAAVACGLALHAVERPFGFSFGTVRCLFGYGIRSHVDSVATIFNERLDQLVISLFLAPLQLGLYVVAVTLSSLTNLIGSSVSMVAMPAVARLSRGPGRTRAAVRYVQVALVSAILVSVPLLLFAPFLIRTLFGSSYTGAIDIARILLVGAVVYSLARVLSTTLKAVGRPLDAGLAELIGLGVTVVALVVLLPLFGLVGAATASVLAYAVSALWMLRRAARALDVAPLNVLVPGRVPASTALTGEMDV